MSVFHRNSPPLILIVDDDVGDQILIQEALESSQIAKQVRIVSDGEEAVAYLRHSGPFADASCSPRPDLILLDLNMPRLGGKEVLALLKSDPDLKCIPVVAFTTSGREEDVLECYRMGVNSYVQKPSDFREFQSVVHNLELYWLQVSLFPGSGFLAHHQSPLPGGVNSLHPAVDENR